MKKGQKPIKTRSKVQEKKSRKSQPVKSEPDPEITACEIRKRAGNHSLWNQTKFASFFPERKSKKNTVRGGGIHARTCTGHARGFRSGALNYHLPTKKTTQQRQRRKTKDERWKTPTHAVAQSAVADIISLEKCMLIIDLLLTVYTVL